MSGDMDQVASAVKTGVGETILTKVKLVAGVGDAAGDVAGGTLNIAGDAIGGEIGAKLKSAGDFADNLIDGGTGMVAGMAMMGAAMLGVVDPSLMPDEVVVLPAAKNNDWESPGITLEQFTQIFVKKAKHKKKKIKLSYC